MKKQPQTRSKKHTLTTEDVLHLARLARIELTNDEVARFQEQLTEVIDYNIELLSEVDVTNVEPTSQTTGLVNVWRDDEPRPSQSQATALSNAPAQKDGYVIVKKVLDI